MPSTHIVPRLGGIGSFWAMGKAWKAKLTKLTDKPLCAVDACGLSHQSNIDYALYMHTLLEKAFSKAAMLPDNEQVALAERILSDLAGDEDWDRLVSSPASLNMLDQMAGEALKAREQGQTTLLDFKNRPRAL